MITFFKQWFTFLFVGPRLFFNVLRGRLAIFRLKQPIVTIFGGARFLSDDFYFKQAHQIAQILAKRGISVLTGGGSGIMHAASCGVSDLKKGSSIMGIGVTNLGEGRNACSVNYIEVDYFFARKWLLTSYSDAFVVFPGGFGTLNELSEVLMLIQTKKLKKVPILLVGVEYWRPFMEWLEGEVQLHGALDKADLALFEMTDDVDYVAKSVCKKCQEI